MTQIISYLHAIAVQRALPNNTSHIHCMGREVYLSPEQHLNIPALICQSRNILGFILKKLQSWIIIFST